MKQGAKVAEPADLLRMELQLFAEGAVEGAASSGGDMGTSSAPLFGDNYASGGPEGPENEDKDAIDMSGFDFEKSENEPEPEQAAEPTREPEPVPEQVRKVQSPEANAAFAEMRRKAAEAEKALKERDTWVEQNFGHSHGIKTWDQYQAAIEQTHRRQQAARQQEMQQRPQQVFQQTYKQLVEGGYDQEVARRMATVEANSVAQALENRAIKEQLASLEIREREKAKLETQLRQQREQEAMRQQLSDAIVADFEKLKKEYGNLVPEKLEEVDHQTVDKLKKGYTLYDAWFLSNRDKVMTQTQKAASQKTLNNLNSKAHLKTEGDGASENTASMVPLPPDTLQMYMDGGMTEKQARAFHKKLYG